MLVRLTCKSSPLELALTMHSLGLSNVYMTRKEVPEAQVAVLLVV
jgi:hypothetical protein